MIEDPVNHSTLKSINYGNCKSINPTSEVSAQLLSNQAPTTTDKMFTSSLTSSGYWEDDDSLILDADADLNNAYLNSYAMDCNTRLGNNKLFKLTTDHESNMDISQSDPVSICNANASNRMRMVTRSETSKSVALVPILKNESKTDNCRASNRSKMERTSNIFDNSSSSSESENEDMQSKPITKFEAALKRAKHKELNRKTNENSSNSCPNEHIGRNKNTSHKKLKDISPKSGASIKDLCTEVEIWLENRPPWLYETPSTINSEFQICFVNSFDKDLTSSSLETVDMIEHKEQSLFITSHDDFCQSEQIHGIHESVDYVNSTDNNLVGDGDDDDDNNHIQCHHHHHRENSITSSHLQYRLSDVSMDYDHYVDDTVDTNKITDLEHTYTTHNNVKSCEPNLTDLSVDYNLSTSAGCSHSDSGRTSLLQFYTSSTDMMTVLKEISSIYSNLLHQCKRECYNKCTQLYLEKLINDQHTFQSATEIAITQVPKMATMQCEIERSNSKILSPHIIKLLQLNINRKYRFDRRALGMLSKVKLQVILSDLFKKSEDLNRDLMFLLMERDELYLEQNGKTVALEDIKTWMKELAIRCTMPHVRRQLFLNITIHHDSQKKASLTDPSVNCYSHAKGFHKRHKMLSIFQRK